MATRLLPALTTALEAAISEAKRICRFPAVAAVMTSSDALASVLALALSMEVEAAPVSIARWLARVLAVSELGVFHCATTVAPVGVVCVNRMPVVVAAVWNITLASMA